MKASGYTLIEILIALSIFALLSVITSASLYNNFKTREHIETSSKQIAQIQYALSVIERDIKQIVDKTVTIKSMQRKSAFIGNADTIEFTRGGFITPHEIDKLSSLKRVAYKCQGKKLVRSIYPRVDNITDVKLSNKVLLNDLSSCSFAFLTVKNEVVHDWQEKSTAEHTMQQSLPKAIQLKLRFTNLGEMKLLYIIPGGLYV